MYLKFVGIIQVYEAHTSCFENYRPKPSTNMHSEERQNLAKPFHKQPVEAPHLQNPREAAYPPYTRHRSTLATLTRQYLVLLRILLSEYRTTWFFHVFGGLLIP